MSGDAIAGQDRRAVASCCSAPTNDPRMPSQSTLAALPAFASMSFRAPTPGAERGARVLRPLPRILVPLDMALERPPARLPGYASAQTCPLKRVKSPDANRTPRNGRDGAGGSSVTLPHLNRLASSALVALGRAELLGHFAMAQQAPAKPVVYVPKIDGVIDLGLAPFVKRVLDEATKAGAAAVILEIDTFGGRVDAAVRIRDTLLDAKVRTVGFVNKRAISAGALIGLATRTLVMAAGPVDTLPRAHRYSRAAPMPDRRAVQDAIVIAAVLQPCHANRARDVE